MLGTVELWSGEAEAALEWFSKAERITDPADGAEPTMSWWRAEQVEALLELGLVDDAEARIDAWEEAARRLDRAWPLAEAARCRGLVAAARGDVDEAIALLEQAVEVTRRLRSSAARSSRSASRAGGRGRSAPAREAIEAACADFEELGAAGWAERARDELGRIGGRTRVEGLTPGGAARRRPRGRAAGRTPRSPRRSSSPSARLRAT